MNEQTSYPDGTLQAEHPRAGGIRREGIFIFLPSLYKEIEQGGRMATFLTPWPHSTSPTTFKNPKDFPASLTKSLLPEENPKCYKSY